MQWVGGEERVEEAKAGETSELTCLVVTWTDSGNNTVAKIAEDE